MANRSAFTREEIVLCIYAARYDLDEIGGLDAIHSLNLRSRPSIRMKIQNIVAMCDEAGISRNTDQSPLTGLPAGETGRRTNWKELAAYANVERGQHLRECQIIIANAFSLPGDLDEKTIYREGATRRILVNAYERDPAARSKCIEHFGPTCMVCGFSFLHAFGAEVDGFIHVHHVTPLSAIGSEYTVDPINDLRPVCPNCHAVIHFGGRTRSIDEVRKMIRTSVPD